MNFSEYRQYDALGLAQLIKNKAITPLELLDIAISRAEEVNPKLNAVIYKMYDYAKQMLTEASEGQPFYGVPFLVKDLGIDIAGQPTTFGSRVMTQYVPPVDSEIAKNIRQAGFLIMGRTNTPEFGLTPFTEPELYGPTLNPWNTAHSPGGSSGGASASISSGIVPLATASDGGGSIRVPAAFTGLFGLKPSRGRFSYGPNFGEAWAGAATDGCLSRSVRDTAAYLDAIAFPIQGDPYLIASPKQPYLQAIETPPGKLKIGFSTENRVDGFIDPQVKSAIEKTAQMLQDLGHEVEEAPLPYQKEDLTRAFLTVLACQTATDMASIEMVLGTPLTGDHLELNTRLMAAVGHSFTASEYVGAQREWNTITRKVAHYHQTYDVWLSPVASHLPFKTGQFKNTDQENMQANMALANPEALKALIKQGMMDVLGSKVFGAIPFTPIANLTGNPSMSVPLHWSTEGLPIGAMFTGRFGSEEVLLQLARQLEQAHPWFDKVPQI